jgi:hypothetical protein
VAAWPICVASYGVIPQTYSLATSSGFASRRERVALSKSRGGEECPATVGMTGLLHDFTKPAYAVWLCVKSGREPGELVH